MAAEVGHTVDGDIGEESAGAQTGRNGGEIVVNSDKDERGAEATGGKLKDELGTDNKGSTE